MQSAAGSVVLAKTKRSMHLVDELECTNVTKSIFCYLRLVTKQSIDFAIISG